jgi:membrane protein implicated in regulation of membrane protease activity
VGLQDLTQISVIELAVKTATFFKKVFFMTVGTIICAVGTTYMLGSSMCGFGLTLTMIGVLLMEVANLVIGTPWAEKTDCQLNAYRKQVYGLTPKGPSPVKIQSSASIY